VARPLRNEKAKYFKALPFLFFFKTLRYPFETCTLSKVWIISICIRLIFGFLANIKGFE
jgi:hypothetical protein